MTKYQKVPQVLENIKTRPHVNTNYTFWYPGLTHFTNNLENTLEFLNKKYYHKKKRKKETNHHSHLGAQNKSIRLPTMM